VNSWPHIGHLYTALLADAHARHRRLLEPGAPHAFVTGTDEHGMKVQQAAANQGLEPRQLCDLVSANFRETFDRFGINYTDYIRTTEKRHAKAVGTAWQRLESNGDLYKAEYSGWYSVQDETFLPEGQVEEREGVHYSLESGHRVEWQKEENWMFRLSRHKPAILDWLRNTQPIQPKQFAPQVEAWLEEPTLGDLSVSRPRQRLHWGLPVPGDGSHTIYVWMDALVNYLTVAGYPGPLKSWPPSVQVIGKDILKFHAIYWPAILLSLDLPLPPRLLVHSHWTVDGVKMSKSLGNVVSPGELADRVTEEGLRYFLLREGVPHTDGNFSEESLKHILNLELADTLGNLLSRATSKRLNPSQEVPACSSSTSTPSSIALLDQLETLSDRVGESYADFQFYDGLVAVMDTLRATNSLVQEEQPWVLGKTDPERRDWVLAIVLESLRVCGILLQPCIPSISSKLLDRLNVPMAERDWEASKPILRGSSRPLGEDKGVLISKIYAEKVVKTEKIEKPKKKKKTAKNKESNS